MKCFMTATTLVAVLMFSSNVNAAPADSATAEYNPNTGEISVSADSVVNWYVQSGSSALTGDAPAGIPNAGGLLTDNDTRIGESDFNEFGYDVDLGAVAETSLDPNDLSIKWNSFLGDPTQSASVTYAPLAIYNYVTGTISISITDSVVNWYVESASSGLTGAPAAGLPGAGGLATDNDARIGESKFGQFSYSLDLGAVAQTGLSGSDLTINWNYNLGDTTQSSLVTIVPEPTTIGLAVLGLCGMMLSRRRKV